MGFDVVFIGEGEYSFLAFLHRLTEKRRDLQDIRGLAFLVEDSAGKKRVMRTGRAPLIELNEHYPSIGLQHHRLGAIEIGRGCPHACGFCQTPFLHGARMRYRSLENTLEHIEQLVQASFKDIRFTTPNALAYLSDDGVHPDYTRLEQALRAMHEVAGKAKIKFGEFPSEMRPEHITPELAQLIDCYSDASYIAIGAQSGSEPMLEAMHREHDVAAVERAVSCLVKYCHKLLIRESCLNNFWCQRHNFHELLVTQLARHRSENPRAPRVQFFVDYHNRIAVKAQIGAVVAPDGLARAHHHRVNHFALFDRSIGRGFLDVRLNDIPDMRVTLVAAQHADGRGAVGAGVVGHIQNGTNL